MSAYPLKSSVSDQLLSATHYKGAGLGGVPKRKHHPKFFFQYGTREGILVISEQN